MIGGKRWPQDTGAHQFGAVQFTTVRISYDSKVELSLSEIKNIQLILHSCNGNSRERLAVN